MDKIKLLWWHGLTVINLLIEEKDFKLQIKLFAHISFQFHLWIFTRWCDSTFFHVIYTVNHVTKRRTTSLGKDSEMESEACVCQKFYLEFETSFMLFTNSFLLKEVNCWKKHWYERVVNAFFFFTFILLDPRKSNKKGEVPRKMLQTQVRLGLSVLAKLIFIYSIILLFARLLVIGRNL